MTRIAALVCVLMLAVGYPVLGQDESAVYPDNLQIVTPENAANIGIVGHLPRLGEIVFTDDDRLFTIHRDIYGSFATVYSLPDLEVVVDQFPVTGRSVVQVSTAQSPVVGFAYSPDGRSLISMRLTDGVSRYDRRTDSAIFNERLWGSKAFDISGAELLATTHFDFRTEEKFLCFVDLLTLADAPQEELCQPFDDSAVGIAFFNDDQQLLVAGTEHITVLDAATRDITQRFPYTSPSRGTMALLPGTDTPDNLPTILLSQEGYVASINLETGEQHSYPNGEGRVATHILPLRDGSRFLAIAASQGGNFWTVFAFDTKTRQNLFRTDIYGGDAVVVNPGSSLVVIGHELYDTTTFESLFTFGGDDHPFTFSRDGEALFVGNSTDKQIHVYGIQQ